MIHLGVRKEGLRVNLYSEVTCNGVKALLGKRC